MLLTAAPAGAAVSETVHSCIATKERAMLLADQEALLKAAKERRELEYRSAVFGDFRYWIWAAFLVALMAGSGGWWLRGVIAPTSANQSSGTLSTQIDQKMVSETAKV
ncbi:hypothetical protein HRE53_30755 (plasmid) [Acaryochloris sp. 'Moss Beach']|uniref:hypothetical protein n=1 Tax=Acaryochloris sp. 'Moss Beach' TaxID=2740837 RepID=UPI001F25C2D6|nr:hypothetical protein [Acaryochloris sp. 'Moss Beach']UJB73096.1 hypothetical protein HRE53_30755 [Acaryochloris sp. 'Moss Beach']